MADLLPITLPEMIKEAERELALRRRVYPRRVRLGQMKQHNADRYIELQEAIIRTLHDFDTIRQAHIASADPPVE